MKKMIIPAATLLTIMVLAMATPIALAQITTVTITAPADGAKFNPGDTISVTGTAPENSVVVVQLKNPSDILVAPEQTKASATGSFSAQFVLPSAAGGSYPFGKYTITVVSTGISKSVSITFEEKGTTPTPPPTSTGVVVVVSAGGPYFPGDQIQFRVLFHDYNGDLTDATLTIWHVIKPDGRIDQLSVQKRIHIGLYVLNYTIPSLVGDYSVHIQGTRSGVNHNSIDVFTVMPSSEKVSTGVSSLSTAVSAVRSDLVATEGRINTRITSAITEANTASTSAHNAITSAIQTAQTGVQSAITTAINSARDAIQSSVSTTVNAARDSVKTDVAGAKSSADGARTAATQAADAIANAGTLILVVAVLAAITLVLELVILVRKL